MSKIERGTSNEEALLQSHRDFWGNSSKLILYGFKYFDQFPLRPRIRDEDLKGRFTPENFDREELIEQYKLAFQDRPLLHRDCFEIVALDTVIPWMEGIIGCEIHSLGKTASMKADPPDIKLSNLPQHLSYILDDLGTSAWYRTLADGTQRLANVFGDRFPMSNTLMRGPGDMMGALLGYENFITLMYKSTDKKLLSELLGLCTKIWIKTAKMQFELAIEYKGGYCNLYGIWVPCENKRFQEDIASLVNPDMCDEFLLPYHIKIANAFDYSVFHMHSGYLSLYSWEGLVKQSNIKCLEVDLDPRGPNVNDIIENLIKMAQLKPLIICPWTEEQTKAVEAHLSDFAGSLAIVSAIEFNKGFES